MSIELILLAVNINLISFSIFSNDIVGQIFTMLILTVAAAEAAIGLAIIVVYYRNRGSIRVEDIHGMKGLMEYAILFLPLLGSLVGYFGRSLTKYFAEISTRFFVSISAVLSVFIF